MSARRKNSVSVAPGIRQVTLTLVSRSSSRMANEKEIEKRLGAVVDSLETAGNEARDRAGDQDAPCIATPHIVTYPVDQIDGAGDVGVDHAPYLPKILIKEGTAKPPPGIGEQRIDRAADPLRCIIELVDTLERRQVRLQGFDGNAEAAQAGRGGFDLRLVRCDQQIEIVLGAAPGKFQAYARGSAGDDGELSANGHSSLRDGMDEADNHDLSPRFPAPSASDKEQVILPDLFIRTGVENPTMKQWHGTAKALYPAAACPIFQNKKDGCIKVVLKP